MDSYHRQPQRSEQATGQDCIFCATFDPNFKKRNPMDRWVHGAPQNTATSHVSENGHVLHLIFEIANRRGQGTVPSEVAKSA
jgi:hypothetical protein